MTLLSASECASFFTKSSVVLHSIDETICLLAQYTERSVIGLTALFELQWSYRILH